MSEPLKPLANPEQCPGAYSLDCYCKWANPAHPQGWTDNLVGETRADCERQARVIGWILHRDGTATCRHCVPLPKANA